MGMGQLLARGRCQQTSQTLGAGGDVLRWSRALGPQEEKSFHDAPGKGDQMVVRGSILDTKGPSSLPCTLFIFSCWATQEPSWYSSGHRGADGSLLAYPSALVCHFAPVGGRPQGQRTLLGLISRSLLSPPELTALRGPPGAVVLTRSSETGVWAYSRSSTPMSSTGLQPFLWASLGLLSGCVWPKGWEEGPFLSSPAAVPQANVWMGVSSEGPE